MPGFIRIIFTAVAFGKGSENAVQNNGKMSKSDDDNNNFPDTNIYKGSNVDI